MTEKPFASTSGTEIPVESGERSPMDELIGAAAVAESWFIGQRDERRLTAGGAVALNLLHHALDRLGVPR